MTKLKKIIDGWGAYLFEDKDIKALASARAQICSECPHAKHGSFEMFLKDYTLKKIQGMKCDICSCPLSTATRSKDYACPLKKW